MAPVLARAVEALTEATEFAQACQAQARGAPPPGDFDADDAAGRRFPGMVGELQVAETLPREAVHAWLRRIADRTGA